jgi:hypothetical protein
MLWIHQSLSDSSTLFIAWFLDYWYIRRIFYIDLGGKTVMKVSRQVFERLWLQPVWMYVLIKYLPRRIEWNHKQRVSWSLASWPRFKPCMFLIQISCHCYTNLLCCTMVNKGFLLLVCMNAGVSVGHIWEAILLKNMPEHSEMEMSF